MTLIRVPTRFIIDHEERDLPTPATTRAGRACLIDTADTAFAELIDDARHYADPHGPDGAPHITRAAKALLAAIDRQPEPGTRGVPHYKAKGFEAGKAGKKLTTRGVPQNFKLAFVNGYWDGYRDAARDHDAQAAYDAENGTDNGLALWDNQPPPSEY